MSVNSQQRGLSLLETIFSLAVLGLIAIVVLDLFPASMLAARHNEQKMQAEMLAESILADYVAQPFEKLVLGPPQNLAPVTIDGMEFRPRVSIYQVQAHNTDHLRGVTVRIGWTFRQHQRHVERELWVANLKR